MNVLRKFKNDYVIVNGVVKEDVDTEKAITAKRRIGHNILRRKLLEKHQSCQICNIDMPELLICSHIKPWSKSNNLERLDKNNAVLLCLLHDKLFDKGFITFLEDGQVKISDLIDEEQYSELLLSDDLTLDVCEDMKPYLRWHQSELFRELP